MGAYLGACAQSAFYEDFEGRSLRCKEGRWGVTDMATDGLKMSRESSGVATKAALESLIIVHALRSLTIQSHILQAAPSGTTSEQARITIPCHPPPSAPFPALCLFRSTLQGTTMVSTLEFA